MLESFTELGKLGAVGLALAILGVGFKVFQIFVQQWRLSTEAVNRNTKSFERLSSIFEKTSEREIEFQRSVINMLHDGNAVISNTNRKVTEIHRKIVARRGNAGEEDDA